LAFGGYISGFVSRLKVHEVTYTYSYMVINSGVWGIVMGMGVVSSGCTGVVEKTGAVHACACASGTM